MVVPAVMEMTNGFLPDEQLQAIAAEHNLAETSFWKLHGHQVRASEVRVCGIHLVRTVNLHVSTSVVYKFLCANILL